jgi:hypothetical protein
MGRIRDYIYDIRHFTWVKDDKTFLAAEEDLYDIQAKYSYPFPNGRKQFFIKNKKTKNQKRFRFLKDLELYGNLYYEFESEEGYRCIIKLADRSSTYEQIKTKIQKLMAEQTKTEEVVEIVNNWDNLIIQINEGEKGGGAIRMQKQDLDAMMTLHGVDRGYILDMLLKAVETTPKENFEQKESESAE